MAETNTHKKWWFTAGMVILAGLGAAANPQTQPPKSGATPTQALYYGAPHSTQKKMVIRFLEDTPLPTGGNVLFKGLAMDTYAETGEPGLTMEAPECVFNYSESAGASPGPLKVRTADGNSFIEGTGYLWTYKGANLTVTISNNVSTTLKRDFLTPGSNAAATNQYVHIHADRVFLDRAANLITYTGHVHVEDERLDLTCDVLTIHGATNGVTGDSTGSVASGKISEIIADQNVVILDKIAAGDAAGRATGDRAVYSVVDGAEVVTLTGSPHWVAGLRDATAQAFIFDRAANTLQALGEAHIKLPSDSIGKSGFNILPQPAAATSAASTKISLMDVTAGSITLALPATNGAPLRGILAETNVLMIDVDNESRVFAERQAVYTQSNGVMELSGQASWKMHRRLARAELLTFNQSDNTFSARTNAYLQFPPNELRQSPGFGGMLATNVGRTTNQLVKVSSDSYDYQNDSLTFHHHVQGGFLEDEILRGTLDSDLLKVDFLHTNIVRDIVAQGGVHLRQLPMQDAQGKTEEGDFKSDRLQILMRTNGLLELATASGGVSASRTEITTNTAKALLPVLTAGGMATNSLRHTNHLKFSADGLTVSFLPDTNRVKVATGEGHVSMTQDDYAASGAKVVYTATNNVIVLSGDPKLETTEGWLTTDGIIIYDRAKGIIQATRQTHTVINLPPGTLDKFNRPAMMQPKPR